MSSGLIWFLVFLQGAVSGGLSAWVASEKKRDAVPCFFIGALFGIFGLIAIAGLPRKQTWERPMASKPCPDCAEPVRRSALVCRYCGHRFNKEEVLDEVIMELREPDARFRLDAVNILWVRRDPKAVELLVKMLNDTDASVRIASASALGQFGDDSAVPALVRRLLQRESDRQDGEIDALYTALESIRSPATIAAFRDELRAGGKGRWLDYPDRAVQLLLSLGESGLEALVEMMDVPLIRDSIEAALLAEGEAAVPHLQKALNHDSKLVSEKARIVLKRMGK